VEIDGNLDTTLTLEMNGKKETLTLETLAEGGRSFFLEHWLSPACKIHGLVPSSSYNTSFTLEDEKESDNDFYYLRVAQQNNQFGWSSPVWVR